MARYNPDANLSPLYETMDRLCSDCLIGDDSLLSPGRQLWTAGNFAELQRTYVQNLDEGEGKFFEKLKVQLTDTTADGHCLMAELIWLLYAFQRRDVSSFTKNLKVCEVWSWSGEELPQEVAALTDPVLHGVGRAGQGYNNNRWRTRPADYRHAGSESETAGRAPSGAGRQYDLCRVVPCTGEW